MIKTNSAELTSTIGSHFGWISVRWCFRSNSNVFFLLTQPSVYIVTHVVTDSRNLLGHTHSDHGIHSQIRFLDVWDVDFTYIKSEMFLYQRQPAAGLYCMSRSKVEKVLWDHQLQLWLKLRFRTVLIVDYSELKFLSPAEICSPSQEATCPRLDDIT